MSTDTTTPQETTPPIPAQQQSPDNPSGEPQSPATLKPEVKQINKRARWAFGGAMLAELLFLLSAFVPYTLSLVCSGISALLAIASMVMGFMALRRRPRDLAVAAIVFSGVLVIIYIIVTGLFFMLPELLNSSTGN